MTLGSFIKIATAQVYLCSLVVFIVIVSNRRISLQSKLIGLLCFLTPLIYYLMMFLTLKGKDVNIPQSIHGILAFILLSFIFRYTLGERYKKGVLTIMVMFVLFALSNLLFIQKNDINTYTKIGHSIIISAYCVFYFYRLLVDLPVQHLHRVPMFWFTAAILIFSTGTLFLFLFTNYLVEVLHNDLLIYWTFHNILNIVQILVILIGIWVDLQNTKSRSSSLSEQ